jgi:hypothetical protein
MARPQENPPEVVDPTMLDEISVLQDGGAEEIVQPATLNLINTVENGTGPAITQLSSRTSETKDVNMSPSGAVRADAKAFNENGIFIGREGSKYVISVRAGVSNYFTFDGAALTIAGVLTLLTVLTAGEDLTSGDVVRIGTDGLAYKASSINSTLSAQTFAFATTNVTSGDQGSFQLAGEITDSGLTTASSYYITDGTTDQDFGTNDSEESVYSGGSGRGQTFTTGVGVVKLDAIWLYGRRVSSGAGDITIDIYATSAGLPTGSSLGTTVLRDSGTFSTSNEFQAWYFESPIALDASTMYAMALTPTGGDVSNTYTWRKFNADSYAGGTGLIYSGSWSTRAEDFNFKTVYFTGDTSLTSGTVAKEVGIAASATKLILRL